MKPAPFTYHRPETVDDALGLLGSLDEVKVLAGGQSLVPLMNFRLAVPEHLVDITGIEALRHVEIDADAVTVGAAVTHAELERHAGVADVLPLLVEVEGWIAHGVIRNRGTVCGSLAHADAAAELPAVLALLGGDVTLRTTERTRTVPAEELFVGPLQSCCEPDELLTHARFPIPPAGTGTAIAEVARRHGDYAIAGTVALVSLAGDGSVARARVSLLSVASRPVVFDLDDLVGRPPDGIDRSAVYDLVVDRLDPPGDIHATADYRRHVGGATAVDALATAAGRALVGSAA